MASTQTYPQRKKRNSENDKKISEFQTPPSTEHKTVSTSTGLNQQKGVLSPLTSVTILSIVLSGLVLFRNTLIWFWEASGDFWQAQWDKVLDTFGEDPFNLWVYGSVLFGYTLYWIVGGIYTIFDITNKPVALRRYKIQPETNEPVEIKKLLKVLMVVLINQTIVSLPVMYLHYHAMKWRGYPPVRKLPTFRQISVDAVGFLIVQETGFYYVHRLLHHRLIYRFIHKRHHEWTAPVAVTALYCHPIEHIFCNALPTLLGIFLMGSHVATAYIWLSTAIIYSVKDHSGYNFPLLSAEAHDFHHFQFNQCYGSLGVLDRLHGTDKIFRSTRLKKLQNAVPRVISAR